MRPVLWMFLGILVTFAVTRGITRYIRHRSARETGESTGPIKDVVIGGVHLHHQVWGILLMFGSGAVLIAGTPQGAALNAVAAAFGVGTSLTFDEFALWLHLEDVYWSESGRKSVDAMFCVIAVTGIFIGGVDLVSGSFLSAEWWGSVGLLIGGLVVCLVVLLKGKIVTGVLGVLLLPIALVGAVRLAKPDSWWSRRFYDQRPRRLARSEARFDTAYEQRWNRMRDLIAGAPTLAPTEYAESAGPPPPDHSASLENRRSLNSEDAGAERSR